MIDLPTIFWIFVLFSGLSAAAIVRSRRKLITDSSCAKRGYLIHGLPSAICPECGSDLSKPHSVIPAGAVKPTPQMLLAILIALMIAPLAAITTPVFVGYLPFPRDVTQNFTLAPRSGDFPSVEIFQTGWGYGPVPSGEIKVHLDPPNRLTGVMHIYAKTMLCEYPSTNWQKTRVAFGTTPILDMMKTTGIDPTKPSAIAEAAQIDAVVQSMAAGKKPVTASIVWSSVSWASRAGTYRPRGYMIVGYAIWAVIGGIVLAVFQNHERWRSTSQLDPSETNEATQCH